MNHLLNRLQAKIISIKNEEEIIGKVKNEKPETCRKEEWVQIKLKGLLEIFEILGLSESQKEPISFAFREIMDDVFEYALRYFKLCEEHFDVLYRFCLLENDFIGALTLVWYQYGCITGDFTRLFASPELAEMYSTFIPFNSKTPDAAKETIN